MGSSASSARGVPSFNNATSTESSIGSEKVHERMPQTTNVTRIQSFNIVNNEDSDSEDGSAPRMVEDVNARGSLKPMSHILESFSSTAPKEANTLKFQDGHPTRFHISNPNWSLDTIDRAMLKYQVFPSTKEELFQYKWKGMQKVGKFSWVLELLQEGNIFDEVFEPKRLYVLLRMDPSRERFLLVQGFSCLFGKALGVRTPNVFIIEDFNVDEFEFVKKQIATVAGSAVMEDAVTSRVLLIQEYFGETEYLTREKLEEKWLDDSFQKSLGEIMAFDIIANNQTHVPCIFPARGNPKNLIFTEWKSELIPIENKPVILTSPEDILVYCTNVENFLVHDARKANFKKQLMEFCKIHYRGLYLNSQFVDATFKYFEQFLQTFTKLTSDELHNILEEISSSSPSIATFVTTNFFIRALLTIQAIMESD